MRAVTEHWEQKQPKQNREGALQWEKPSTSTEKRGLKEVTFKQIRKYLSSFNLRHANNILKSFFGCVVKT